MLYPIQLPIALALISPVRSMALDATNIVIPSSYGPFNSTLQHFELIDVNRRDPFNSSHLRRLMVTRFDPVPVENCGKAQLVPYMTPEVARVQAEVEVSVGVPQGPYESLRLNICSPTIKNVSQDISRYPVAIFSPGYNTSRLLSSALAQAIATKGYTVLTLDHPYETNVVEYPDGSVIYGGRLTGDANNTQLVAAVTARANDVSFLLDTLGFKYGVNERRAIVIGQSFGGATAALVMLNDTRIRGGVNLDGAMYGDVLKAGLGRPGLPQAFLLFGSTDHNSSSDSSWTQMRESLNRSKDVDWVRELNVLKSGHWSYADIPMVVDLAGLRNGFPKDFLGYLGDVTGKRMFEIVAEYISAFFKLTLEGKKDGVLAGPSASWPEVVYLP